MHQNDLNVVLLVAAIGPMAHKHHLSTADLVRHVRELRSDMNIQTIERAALLATVRATHLDTSQPHIAHPSR